MIVVYHAWMDGRRPRRETPVETAHEARPAERPSAP
jgi:hypothetical protein